MKNFILLSFFFFLISGFVSLAQNPTLEVKQTNQTGIYTKGEKIRVMAFIQNRTNDSIYVVVRKNNNQIISKKAFLPEVDSLLIFEGSSSKPSSFMVEARIKEQKQRLGMIVDPQNLKPGIKAPKDLNKYWNTEKQLLTALQLDVKFGKNESKEFEFVCFDTEINCTSPKPARGYFARPTKAAPKSLPIVLLVHAAGVKGSWCKSEAEEALRYAKMGKGAMCFDLNAHGMLNGQPDEYYSDLEAGELKDYYIQGMVFNPKNSFVEEYLK